MVKDLHKRERIDTLGRSSILPYLPITLSNGSNSVEVMALLDTGASVNVLPYEIGIQLGAIWEEQTVPIQLSGNLASSEARGLVISGTVAQFSPILLAFACPAIDRRARNPRTPQLFCRV